MWRWNSRIPFLENGHYHIYNRGYNKSIILKNRYCFEKFYSYLLRYSKEFEGSLEILSYCLLPNHFHLIVRNLDGTGTQVSKFMKKLQWAYSVWLRVKYPLEDKGTGTWLKLPVFEWRFKAKLIKTDEYLAQCIHYVNYNPLKHKIVTDIAQYPWTSYHHLTQEQKNQGQDDLILSELEY